MQGQPERGSSPLSIASIVASMTTAAVGSGLMFAYSPYMLSLSANADWAPGAAVTAVAFGGLVGCVVTGPLIQRVGHARLFACSMAIVIIAAALIASNLSVTLWILARGLYGAAANCNFIIAQSWLNHARLQHWRGARHVLLLHGLCAGAWLRRLAVRADPDIRQPDTAPDDLLYRACHPADRPDAPAEPAGPGAGERGYPHGLADLAGRPDRRLGIGGLSMVVQGFVPIYATTNGVGQTQVGLLMFVMQRAALRAISARYPVRPDGPAPRCC